VTTHIANWNKGERTPDRFPRYNLATTHTSPPSSLFPARFWPTSGQPAANARLLRHHIHPHATTNIIATRTTPPPTYISTEHHHGCSSRNSHHLVTTLTAFNSSPRHHLYRRIPLSSPPLSATNPTPTSSSSPHRHYTTITTAPQPSYLSPSPITTAVAISHHHITSSFLSLDGANEELSDGGSPRVIVYGYDGLLMLLVAPPSPDYVPDLEEPQTPPAPQDEDEHEPMFIQPHYPNFIPEPIYPQYIPLEDEHILSAEEQPLPPVDSPTAESPEYVAESDPEEDLEEYEDDETEDGLVDYPMGGGDDGDDDDDDSSEDDADDEDEDEEEEEHLAPTDSAVVIPTDKLAAISFPPEAEVERLLAMPTRSPSPLTSLSPPSAGERLATCTAPAALPSLPLPPPLHMPPPVDHWDDIPETEMPPRKRLCLSTLGSRYKVGESSTTRPIEGRGIDYEFVSTLDDLYALLEDSKDSRTRISHRVDVDSHRVDLVMEDRIAHQETIQIIEDEAYDAREMQQTEISELRETDRRRQAQMVETLRVMGDMRREMGDMQAELLALREQPRRAGQPGGDARVPNQQDAPRDADSHI
nr:hypothetical protein [Tanacetum cinerariifolium]